MIPTILAMAFKAISKFFPDANQAAQAQLELQKLQISSEMAEVQNQYDLEKEQVKTNEAAASSSSVFVSGARSFIIWGCGIALMWTSVAFPFLDYLLRAFGVHVPPLPKLDGSELSTILMSLLGLHGMQVYQHVQGQKE